MELENQPLASDKCCRHPRKAQMPFLTGPLCRASQDVTISIWHWWSLRRPNPWMGWHWDLLGGLCANSEGRDRETLKSDTKTSYPSPTSGSIVTKKYILRSDSKSLRLTLLVSKMWSMCGRREWFLKCEILGFALLRWRPLIWKGNSLFNCLFLCRSELEGIRSVHFNCQASPATAPGHIAGMQPHFLIYAFHRY